MFEKLSPLPINSPIIGMWGHATYFEETPYERGDVKREFDIDSRRVLVLEIKKGDYSINKTRIELRSMEIPILDFKTGQEESYFVSDSKYERPSEEALSDAQEAILRKYNFIPLKRGTPLSSMKKKDDYRQRLSQFAGIYTLGDIDLALHKLESEIKDLAAYRSYVALPGLADEFALYSALGRLASRKGYQAIYSPNFFEEGKGLVALLSTSVV